MVAPPSPFFLPAIPPPSSSSLVGELPPPSTIAAEHGGRAPPHQQHGGLPPVEIPLPRFFCCGHRHHRATRCAVEEEEGKVAMGISEKLKEGGGKVDEPPMPLGLHVSATSLPHRTKIKSN
uniref:Uncharacterized protein n=1 Tax=Oryza sativa subsp. japonica TaxID=39947 RepID=Q6ZC41_ORYSJ|nr:hypothetical protein [Oryza sativa Japonica Group]